MIGYWLTTIFFVIMLLFVIFIFIYAVKTAVNPEDAHKIDPLPKGVDDDKT
ncbi:hypothetical protein [Bacillus kexueae]|uniref:hypothetical protein n=1 Tax=Aeribacillus kexueae TaxID=2078952 RepID=UPI001FAEB2B1|nr:hypothetical protein [Bacillus kexueae]